MQYPCLKRLPAVEYLAPQTLEEATTLLGRYQPQARILAGGTDLVLKMKRRYETPKYIISLKNIRNLDSIHYSREDGLHLGPLVRVHDIETSSLINDKFPILAQAAATLGSAQVRNLATVVGNLCTALPSADMAPGLIVLGANLKLLGPKGERILPVESFFVSPGVSALEAGELAIEVRIPDPPADTGAVYLKHSIRSAMDLSVVSVAALVSFDKDICRDARICLGTMGPTPLRAKLAEDYLKGKTLDQGLIEEIARIAPRECSPRSSIRASAGYRREIAGVLTARALKRITDNKPDLFGGH
jgi:CO/xanthine dehydrogenase FAD-binding subunit